MRITTTALIAACCLGALFDAANVDAANAAADCYSAAIAAPAGGHYALSVQNRCKAPVALAVCWRWGGNTSPQSYKLSRSGTVTFLGPEQTKETAATTTWLRCANSAGADCRIDCGATAANTPVAPAQPKPQQASLPPQPAPPPAPPPPQWGAIAAGIDTALTGTTGHAGVGWALGDSSDAASQAALDQCKRQGVVSCKIVDLYNEGCAYITTGNNGSGGYGWGTAATSERAVALCASQGLACQKPIGGCVR